MIKRTLKQFLNDNKPDNILNYIDPTDIWSIQPGFKRWYESDPSRKNGRIARFVYGIIIAIPKIEKWSTDTTYAFWKWTRKIQKRLK